MKKQKRTKAEQIKLLNTKKEKEKRALDKAKKEAQKLESRIFKREAEGLSAKFLKKVLSSERKTVRSIRHIIKSIDQELDTLKGNPWINGFFIIIEKTCKKNIITKIFKFI